MLFLIGHIRYTLQRHQTLRAMVEKGMEIPPQLLGQGKRPPSPRRDLRRGILLICAGIGIGLFLIFADGEEGAGLGLIPILIGVGYLIVATLESRRERQLGSRCRGRGAGPLRPPAVGPSDPELIARVVADDDRHAFAELVRRHQSAVRSLLRRLTCGDARPGGRSGPGRLSARLPRPGRLPGRGTVLVLAVPDRLQRVPVRHRAGHGASAGRGARRGGPGGDRRRACATISTRA